MLAACTAVPAWAQDDLARLDRLWQEGAWESVARGLYDYLAGDPSRQTWPIVYMLGASYCLAGAPDYGGPVLDIVLRDNRLTEKLYQGVLAERIHCADPPAGRRPATLVDAAAGFGPAGVSSHNSKEFYFLSCGEHSVRNGFPVVVRPVPESSFTTRRIPLDQPAGALRATLALLGGPGSPFRRPRADTVGAFVVTGDEADSVGPTELRQVGLDLMRYRSFYIRGLGLAAPESFITAYVVRSPDEVRRLSEFLYGVRPPDDAIGFSNGADLSLMGVGGLGRGGTLHHELVHVMLRGTLPSPPDWLDEGLAALYEVSHAAGDSILGDPNWRGMLLRGVPYSAGWTQPAWTLMDLRWFFLPPREFRQWENHEHQVGGAVRFAVARYLMLYLQERGALGTVVRGAASRPLPLRFDSSTQRLSVDSTYPQSLVGWMAGLVGDPPARFEQRFWSWLKPQAAMAPDPCR